ncbi:MULTISPECIES: nuclear transport factor 2 family protein [Caballeronia]|uniref:nuclear transport factor 2 family protein n=1 Tax=Caballeronia TaxID=1827195 RepID=UPI001FD43298|nr:MULTISPECIES: nuclear transport factor 2 family protein [Caballeronia]MDR5799109.1 nuclear transport factor 2 family protein [Caballeronia sp. LZ001]
MSDENEVKKIIEEKHALIAEAFRREDASIIANQVFSEDGWCIGAAENNFHGRAAIEKVFSSFVTAYNWTSSPNVTKVTDAMAWDLAEASIRSKHESDSHHFKLLFVWQKVGETWRAGIQMYVDGKLGTQSQGS